MKSIPSILMSAALLLGAPLFAQHEGHASKSNASATAKAGKLIKVGEKESAWAAKARESYPLQVCVASDEKLGSMGDSPQYIYRVDGKPDRLVVFCCEGCEEDFLKDPEKHLAKLDQAAQAKGTKKAGAKQKKAKAQDK